MRKYLRSGALVALALTFALGLIPGSAFASLAGVTVGETTLVSAVQDRWAGAVSYSYGGSMSDDGRYVVFSSYSNNIVWGDRNWQEDVFRYDRTTGLAEVVSVNSDEAWGTGNSQQPYISGNGRYVVFRSSNSNFNSDNDGDWHIYVRDMVAGTTTLVDRADGAAGAIGTGWEPAWPSISDDGTKVVFESNSTNLVDSLADGSDDVDVFMRNLSSNTTTVVATASDGSISDSWSNKAHISGNGGFVVFQSGDSGLVPATAEINPSGFAFLYRKNLSTGALALAAFASDGDPILVDTNFPGTISDDGRYVAFVSHQVAVSTDLDGEGYYNVYVADLQSASVELASISADGTAFSNYYASNAVISGDGRSVLFYSNMATNLVVGDSDNADMFVRDLDTDTTVLVSNSSEGDVADDDVYAPSVFTGITDDGSLTAFGSVATNLLGDTKTFDMYNVFIAKASGTPIGVIECATNQYPEWGADAEQPVLSENLRYVVFRTDFSLLVEDNNNDQDVYRYDRTTGDLALVSVHLNGNANDDNDSGFDDYAVSADGRYVAFPSDSSDLVADDTNNKRDIFLRDMVAGTTVRLNEGKAADGSWWQPTWEASHVSMSSDGRYIAFHTASKLESETVASWGSTNRGYAQVYVVDRQGDDNRANDTVTLVSQAAAGWISAEQEGPEGVNKARISADGKWIVLSSKARLDQEEYATTSYPNIYLRSLESTQVIRVTSSYDPSVNDGLPNGDCNQAVVSADGSFVAFHVDDATNIVENDTNNENDVYLWSRATGATVRITHAEDGTEANDESSHPSISADGRYVMFHSFATNLDTAEGDLNSSGDAKEIFLYDVAADKSMLVDGIDGWSQQVSFVANSDGTAGVAYAGSPRRVSDCEGAWVTTLSVPPTAAPRTLTKIGGNKFLGNSAKLTALAQRDLRTAARVIARNGYKAVAVRGYTSRFGEGSAAYRLRLSTIRAQAAKSYLRIQLAKLGVTDVRIVAKGYGGTKPIATNLTFAGRQKNRRVEIWAK